MTRVIVSAVLLVAVASAALAATGPEPGAAGTGGTLNYDSNQPIAVNADSFLADLNGKDGTFTGNVVVSQGNVRLHADEVKVSTTGSKTYSRMEAHGHVVVNSPSGNAVGDMGVYDVAQQMLRLTGHVVLTKEANVMRGSALDVQMATGLAHLTAAPDAAGQGTGRVQGLFVPVKPDAATGTGQKP